MIIISFRHATIEDLPAMKQLFAGTILSVCRADYTEEQTAVWASSINKEERWLDVVANQFVLLAEVDDVLVGFGTLKDHHYIDFFYVHTDFQGMGIARELLKRLLDEAISHGQKLLSSDISITAKPFFEKYGFKVIAEQENLRQDVVLINYKMIRYLPGPELNAKIKAVYVIEDTFKITGRGLVFAGRIVEGELSTGDHIEFTVNNRIRCRKITGVEFFSGPHVDHAKTGILIKCENEAEIDEFHAWRPFNEIARIYDPGTSPA